jgi:hypothetical protein
MVSPQPLNSLLAILKNILELEQWINRNQAFRNQWEAGTANKFGRYISNKCYSSNMFSPKPREKLH